MSKKSSGSSLLRVGSVRPGEGHAVPIKLIQKIGVDGRTATLLEGNIATAPVPDRKYVADAFGVITANNIVKLAFVQNKVDGGFRSMLVIHLGSDAVSTFIESLPGPDKGTQSFEQIAAVSGVTASEPIAVASEPAQCVALKASAIYVAFSAADACLDFYQISPSTIHTAKQTMAIGVEPVVRVDISTAQLLGLCAALKQIDDDRPKRTPKLAGGVAGS